jgi:hypothetical protein
MHLVAEQAGMENNFPILSAISYTEAVSIDEVVSATRRRMAMEAEWLAKRATLRWLLQRFPQWTNQEYADYLGTSVGWVKTWKKRLKAADPDDLEVLHARSTARKTPAPPLHALIVERIVQIRLSPPQGMPRVPGARTICTFLQADWSPASRRDHTAALLAHGQQGAPSRRLDSPQIRAPSPATGAA